MINYFVCVLLRVVWLGLLHLLHLHKKRNINFQRLQNWCINNTANQILTACQHIFQFTCIWNGRLFCYCITLISHLHLTTFLRGSEKNHVSRNTLILEGKKWKTTERRINWGGEGVVSVHVGWPTVIIQANKLPNESLIVLCTNAQLGLIRHSFFGGRGGEGETIYPNTIISYRGHVILFTNSHFAFIDNLHI